MRNLSVTTLTNAAKHYAKEFNKLSVPSVDHPSRFVGGRNYVLQDLYNFTFKDEFEFIKHAMETEFLDVEHQEEFQKYAKDRFEPRSTQVFEEELAARLAIDVDGNHLSGVIGTTQLGARIVGKRTKETYIYSPRRIRDIILRRKHGVIMGSHIFVKNKYWPLYAGELAERAADTGVADILPEGAHPFVEELLATNPRISNEIAILMCDACVDNLDEGAGAAVIQGRTGSQPADPDTTVSGTLLFTLVCSATAFGGASDDTGKATATAASITSDTSADATDTLGYCRASSTADGATPADDHIDGEAGTSGADFNFNTLAIVSGATVAMTAWTLSVPES